MEYFFDPEISMMMRELPEGTLELDFSDPITCRSTLETFAGAMEMDFSGIQVTNEFVESEPDGRFYILHLLYGVRTPSHFLIKREQ